MRRERRGQGEEEEEERAGGGGGGRGQGRWGRESEDSTRKGQHKEGHMGEGE